MDPFGFDVKTSLGKSVVLGWIELAPGCSCSFQGIPSCRAELAGGCGEGPEPPGLWEQMCAGGCGNLRYQHSADTAGQVSARSYCSICDTMFELLSVKAESPEVSKKWGVGAGCAS